MTHLCEQKYNLKAIMRCDHKSHKGSPCRSVFTFILILMSLIRFQESKQDLIGSSLLNRRETGSS